MKKMIFLFVTTIALYSCSQSDNASLLKSKCVYCHNLVPICNKLGVRDVKGWLNSIDAMNKAGAKVSDADKEKLANYLSSLKPEAVDFCK